MSRDLTLKKLIENEKFEWLRKNLLPLMCILNINEEAIQDYRFHFTFPLSKENLIENLRRITNKHVKLIIEEFNKFDDAFQMFFEFKIISGDDKYKHIPPRSKNSYWHKIYHCNSTKDSEISYFLGFELDEVSKIALKDLNLNSNSILTKIIKNIHCIEDLIYLGIISFITRENQYNTKFNFEKGCYEKDYNFKFCSDLYFLLQNTEIDEEIIDYYFTGKIIEYITGSHPFDLEFESLLRILGKEDRYFATFYTHSFVSTSCDKSNNIIIEQNVAKDIYEKLDRFPFKKWLKNSYGKIKSEMEKDEISMPLFEYKPQFKLLKRIKDSNQLCVFDIEHNEELMEALNYFTKSHVLKKINDDITIGNETRFSNKYDEMEIGEQNRIEKNKRKILTRWLRWISDDLNKDLNDLIESKLPTPPTSKSKKGEKTKGFDDDDSPIPSTHDITFPPPLIKKEINILLGQDENQQDIYWIPENERNWNFVIVGTAGTGKTQTVKAILSEFKKSQIPYIIFDFRKDFILNGNQKSDFGRILDLNSISINPLELDVISPKDQKYQISDIIDLVYNLGDLQLGNIRKAIKASYEQKGISEEDNKTWKIEPPTFKDLQINLEKLAEKADSRTKTSIEGIFARLDPIFDYKIFSAKTNLSFKKILEENTVIDLGILPNENLKAIVSEFFLQKLRYYLNSLSESIYPKFYIIIDEAHRLKYEKNSSIGQFFKEARKYGVGIILSTQDPVDFTELVYNNLGGILSLQLNEPKYAKKISEHLGGDIKWQEIKNDLSSKFSAIVKFTSAPNAIKFKISPYFKRKYM